MSYPVVFLLAFLGLLLQSTIFSYATIAGVKPDFVLILVLFTAILEGPKRGAFFGYTLGLFEDIITGRFIGMNALSKGLTGLLIGWFADRTYSENLLVPIISVFTGTIINGLIFFILAKISGLNWAISLWLWKTIPMALYNTCLVPFMYSYFFYRAADKNKGKQIGPEFWERFI